MIRWLTRALAIVVFVAIAVIVLGFAELLLPAKSDRIASMAPSIPACDGRVLIEGFTYKIRDPSEGDIVAIHAAKTNEGDIVPDRDARDLVLLLRVAGGPGDRVVSRDGTVYVNEVKFDDIRTEPFPPVDVPNEQYFVLGDNRSASIDSRTFGPILQNAIFGRVRLVFWPLRDFGRPEGRQSGPPPGPDLCT